MIALLFADIRLKLIRSDKLARIIPAVKFTAAMEAEDDQANTGQDIDIAQKLRAATANTLHMSALVLSEPQFRQTLAGLALLVRPAQKWYGQMARDNKSSAEGLAFALLMARGVSRDILSKSVDVLRYVA